MRPLTCVPLLAVLAACPPGPGPTTDTGATTTATTGQTDASTGTSNPTTGIPDTTGGSTTEGSTSTTDTTDATTTSPVDVTTTTDPSTTSSDDTSTGAPGTSTGPDEGALVIAIVDAELYADCQPRIDPDPVQGGWFVSFDNTLGASDTAATLVSATLSLADVDPPVLEPILVDPTASGPIPAGQQIDKNMDKLHGDMHSACDHCGEFYKLVLTYDESGTMHVAEEDVTISCSF